MIYDKHTNGILFPGPAVAMPSFGQRLKMSVAGRGLYKPLKNHATLLGNIPLYIILFFLITRYQLPLGTIATSGIGQAMITSYLDPSGRDLLNGLVQVASILKDITFANSLKRSSCACNECTRA